MAALEKVDTADVQEVALAPDTDFEQIVALLRKVWTAPKASGLRGCGPSRSGLDRFMVEDPAFRNFGRC